MWGWTEGEIEGRDRDRERRRESTDSRRAVGVWEGRYEVRLCMLLFFFLPLLSKKGLMIQTGWE